MKRNTQQGNILIVSLIMIMVVSGFVGVALNATNFSSRTIDRSDDYAASQAAAEGAVEYAYGVWKARILALDRSITTTEATATLTAPTFANVTYSSSAEAGPLQIQAVDGYGAPMTNTTDYPTAIVTDLAAYPGWRGYTYNYVCRAKFQQSNGYYNFRVGVKRQFQYSAVPLFQSMFFYEHDLEIYHPASITLSGLIHTNGTAYLVGMTGEPLTITGNVSYVTGYTAMQDPPLAYTWSGYAPSSDAAPIFPNGASTQVKQVARMEPIGTDPASVINTTDANPNNDSLRELIEPPNTSYTDPPEFAQRRLYNKAGILININGGTVTVTAQNGASITSTGVTNLKAAITSHTTIYDQREGANVDVSNFDISKLNTALTAGGVSNFNNVLYINDTTPQVSGNLEPKTIRLVNGGVLPTNGLTVASENPIYVQGDYNTGTTNTPTAVPANSTGNPNNTDSPTVSGYTRKPASVIADAVMLLSNAWSDSNSNQPLTKRQATNTTYNTAILSGFMPSGYQPSSGAAYGYSGGAINYPRFLEDWTDNACTYYGSMVELFQSQTFTGQWDTGVIYRPPDRRWNFDTNFTNAPPPGSIEATTWARGTWAKY